jgi:hypothetical protein
MNEHDSEVALRQLSATVTALELAVKVLIVTHPDRKQLTQVWRLMLPEQIDHFMEHPAYAVAHQREALHKMLADLGEFIEMDLPGDEPDPE